jgi:D-alanine-D-alanine ligase
VIHKPNSILLIYSVVDSLPHGEPENIIADLETVQTAQTILEALRANNYPVTSAPIRTLDDLRAALAQVNPATTLVFNLCETLGGISTGEPEVVRVLDQAGFCYVGATADNLAACLDKGYTKQQLLKRGIPTAPYQVFHTGDEPITVPLPVIIKPVAEDSSQGINTYSVVNDEPSLRRQVAYILQTYQQPAFSPLRDLPHLQVNDFASKWSDRFNALYPAPIDADLREHLSQIALASYKTMGCQDFARVDMREKDGQFYVLEVNPNPCLAADAGFATAAQVAGYTYAQMVGQLVEWAWRQRPPRSNGR